MGSLRTKREGLAAMAAGTCAGAFLYPASAHAAGGLNLIPDPQLLVMNFIVLLVLIYPVNRWLLQPLVTLLEEREARTAGATERAGSLSDETTLARAELEERLARAHANAQSRRAALLAEAEAGERELLEAARADAAREVDAVRGSVADELEAARQTLRQDARTLARDAAHRILGRELS